MLVEDGDQDFILSFSNHIIEHLGVKLYQNKPTKSLAELVANAWDAEAEHVWIDLDLEGPNSDWWISVGDNGLGMSARELQYDYLVVGRKRRSSSDETTPNKRRPLMGRKGIGKLAPFGIANLVDILTIKDSLATWISLNLEDMLSEGESEDPEERVNYRPLTRSREVPIDALKLTGFSKPIQDYLSRQKNNSGTLVILRDFTFRSRGWANNIVMHLANRFIPILSETDFEIYIDNAPVTIESALPSHALRIPEEGGWEEEVLDSGRSIRYWALVVDLEAYKTRFKEDWTQDRAGVAVYTHRKIAQERPFFFNVKGREIYSRYLYGVIEADWVDELDDDVISTDRSTLNWEAEELLALARRGEELVRTWLDKASEHLRSRHRDEVSRVVDERLELVPKQHRDQFSREEISKMAEAIKELAPRTSTSRVVDITITAVSHLPSWELLKNLVNVVVSGDLTEATFSQLVFDFRFFENVNLAQVIARRLQAMEALAYLINVGAREVTPGHADEIASVDSMHDLLSNNPWLIDLRWAAVADELPPQLAPEVLADIEDQIRRRYSDDVCEFESWRRVGKKAIDFFMLHVTEFENVIIIVEIKRANKALNVADHRQIEDYMNQVDVELERHPQKYTIQGLLIGGSVGSNLRNHLSKHGSQSIKTTTWRDLQDDAKRVHKQFLSALAVGLHDDPRLRSYLQDLNFPAAFGEEEE